MPATEHKDYPNQVYAWYVVGVLTVAYIFSFIDRQILNLLVEPIREDLQLSDTQISLLQGIAFALFYTLMGIPIARLADVANRRSIIAAGVFLWSLMTTMCGLAKTFWHWLAVALMAPFTFLWACRTASHLPRYNRLHPTRCAPRSRRFTC